ncbi:MAG: acetolactate synthase large subunit [Phenylobacterium sp.]|nr:acetolactate synthase large subunit [Phenylobacterium sp.]
MNGAGALIQTLVANQVTACFANPGTSEMQFVAALDREPRMRPVLCLFEGVATGAADGYGRIADRPACTLLHLGPGYGNGVANLHNARRAFTPLVNIVGDHATYHRQYDPPLNSDIATLARPNSIWTRSADSADQIAALTAEAVQASYGPPGGPVSLILPADTAWLPTSAETIVMSPPQRSEPDVGVVADVARAIRRARKPVILLGGQACRAEALAQAGRLAAAGITIYADTFVPRQARGAGAYAPRKMPYHGEVALAELTGVDLMICVDTGAPVAFFAYPDRPSTLLPEGCSTLTLVERGQDAAMGLLALAEALDAPRDGLRQQLKLPDARAQGALDPFFVGAALARHMPEGAILCDDSVTSSVGVVTGTATARPHEVLALTGGAIGIGLPLAIGASVAAPDRKVLSLNGDGSALYTLQALWTMAREGLDITVVVFVNHSYRILNVEMERTGSGPPGSSARRLLDLGEPEIDWIALARGMGLPATACSTAEEFDVALDAAMSQRGPMFIAARI